MSSSSITAMSCTLPETRPLDGMELCLSQMGKYFGPDIIIGSVSGPLSLSLLQHACFRVLQRHPMLRSSIHSTKSRDLTHDVHREFKFHAPDMSVVCKNVVQMTRSDIEENEEWKHLLVNEGRSVWECVVQMFSRRCRWMSDMEIEGFMWKCVYVLHREDDSTISTNDGRLIICANHAFVDGISLQRLLNDVLVSCRDLHNAVLTVKDVTNTHDMYTAASKTLPNVEPLQPAKSAYLSSSIGWLTRNILPRIVLPIWMKMLRNFKPVFPPAEELHKIEELDHRFEFRTGSPGMPSRLRELCRRQGVTVGGALFAAVQFATCKVLVKMKASIPRSSARTGFLVNVPMGVDVNMRPYVDPPLSNDHLAVYTSIVDIKVTVKDNVDFWLLARKLKSSLTAQFKANEHKKFLAFVNVSKDYEYLLKKYSINPCQHGGAASNINISNVGPYKLDQKVGPFELLEFYGCNGMAPTWSPLILWLRTLNERFFYTISYAKPVFDDAMGKALFESYVEILESLVAWDEDGITPTLKDFAEIPDIAT